MQSSALPGPTLSNKVQPSALPGATFCHTLDQLSLASTQAAGLGAANCFRRASHSLHLPTSHPYCMVWCQAHTHMMTTAPSLPWSKASNTAHSQSCPFHCKIGYFAARGRCLQGVGTHGEVSTCIKCRTMYCQPIMHWPPQRQLHAGSAHHSTSMPRIRPSEDGNQAASSSSSSHHAVLDLCKLPVYAAPAAWPACVGLRALPGRSCI